LHIEVTVKEEQEIEEEKKSKECSPMSPIGFPPPAARFPILSETARPAAIRPAPPRAGGVTPTDRPERPEPVKPQRLDRPLRTDNPERPDATFRPDRPDESVRLGPKRLAQITRKFVEEAKAIMKNGGTMKDVAALARKIVERIPALEKFPPFQKILERIAYNLNNGSGHLTPVGPVTLERAEAVANLSRRDPVEGPVAKNPVFPTKLSVIV
jgi:hypothetical protein